MTPYKEKATEIVKKHYSDETIREMDRIPRMNALRSAIASAIEDAVNEEREACAKIAATNTPGASLADMAWQSGYDTACATISGDILSRGEPEKTDD